MGWVDDFMGGLMGYGLTPGASQQAQQTSTLDYQDQAGQSVRVSPYAIKWVGVGDTLANVKDGPPPCLACPWMKLWRLRRR